MKLLKLRTDGFGPLVGEWTFASDRLNLVVDSNERGKTSLLAAVCGALYGLPDDRRTHRVLTPRERWRPWSGGAFNVELEIQVRDRWLKIARDFERDTIAVFDDGGHEITSEFLAEKDEYPVGQRLLGLDLSEFEKCALVRQGDLDAVVPGDEKARRASTLRSRLENAADSHVGDTNASEALRVLEDAVRRYSGPEVDSTVTVETAIQRLEAKQGLIEAERHAVEQDLANAQEPLERLAQLADEEERLKDALRALEAERQAGFAVDVRRQLEEDERHRSELAALEREAAELDSVATVPMNVEADLRDTVARHEEAKRNLATLEKRRGEELERERARAISEREAMGEYSGMTAEDADRCVALAADLRRVNMDQSHFRQRVFDLREQLASMGYEPERIQALNDEFGTMSEDRQQLLRRQNEINLAFQTEVAGLEQDRTRASETLRSVDSARNATRLPGGAIAALGAGAALAGLFVLMQKGALAVWLGLVGGGLVALAAGVAMLAASGRMRASDRDMALRRLSESQRRLNQLRNDRAENEVSLADLARTTGHRDSVDLLRYWNEYARMLDDSGPLLRAQEELAEAMAERAKLIEQARPLLRPQGEHENASVTPEALDQTAAQVRRLVEVCGRLDQLGRSWEQVERERRVDEASVAGLHERAVRLLQAAGLTYDPARSWEHHFEELRVRTQQRDRRRVLVDEIIPFAKRQLLPEPEIAQRRKQLEALVEGREPIESSRSAAELEVETRRTRERLEETQRRRSDLRVEVEDTVRRLAQRQPELESQLATVSTALARARAFREAVELARATIQKVAVDTHRRWADFLNGRVAELLGQFGARVDHLRFGEDLDFSVQLEGGPMVSRGKAHLQLSTGARDQLYLAVRLAVSEFLSRGGESLPLLLDDAFATSDDDRMQAGMRALIESFGTGHQLIVVTCHRGRHQDLRTMDPDLFRERVNWLDLGAGAPLRGASR